MALPSQPPSPAPGGAPAPGGPPPQPGPGGPPEAAEGEGGAGQEVIAAIKTLMLFAQAQKQQGNEGPAQALQAFVQSLGGHEGGGQPPQAPGPAQPPEKGQMSMNAAKGASPVM